MNGPEIEPTEAESALSGAIEALESEIEEMTLITERMEERAESAAHLANMLASVVRERERVSSRYSSAVAQYNKEVEKIAKYGRRAVDLAKKPQPVEAAIPASARQAIISKREIEAYAASVATEVKSREDSCGVYFLLSGDKIVYVGQSVSIQARIFAHLGTKEFDRACWFPVPKHELDDVEGALISLLKPEHNRRGVTYDTERSTTLFAGVA